MMAKVALSDTENHNRIDKKEEDNFLVDTEGEAASQAGNRVSEEGKEALSSDEKRPASVAEPSSVTPVKTVKRNDFSFALRGGALNRIIDCASPLLALIMRMSNLGSVEESAMTRLHGHCCHEVEAIDLELHKAGYDRVTILAFRYCLCSVLDEAVMTAPHGVKGMWAQQSLLALYHQETWGGEKFFVITERLMDEPHRYIDILEFLYLCMALGYKGKYRPEHAGKLDLGSFMKEVYEIIRKERGYPDALETFVSGNISVRKHYISWQTPTTMVLCVTLFVAALLYLGFFVYTENYTGEIIAKLHSVLGRG